MKDYKKVKCENNTYTSNFNEIDRNTDNLYQSLVLISKRSNQISSDIKEELSRKIEEFSYDSEALDEVFENNEQIEISKFYERLPKPNLIALDEWRKEEIDFKLNQKES